MSVKRLDLLSFSQDSCQFFPLWHHTGPTSITVCIFWSSKPKKLLLIQSWCSANYFQARLSFERKQIFFISVGAASTAPTLMKVKWPSHWCFTPLGSPLWKKIKKSPPAAQQWTSGGYSQIFPCGVSEQGWKRKIHLAGFCLQSDCKLDDELPSLTSSSSLSTEKNLNAVVTWLTVAHLAAKWGRNFWTDVHECISGIIAENRRKKAKVLNGVAIFFLFPAFLFPVFLLTFLAD